MLRAVLPDAISLAEAGSDETDGAISPPHPKKLPSLKLTFSHLKMDGWKTFSFPFGARPIFRGELLVSGRVKGQVDVSIRAMNVYTPYIFCS